MKKMKKMKDNFTDITVVLDRSASMSSILDETISGFNTFVDEQKNDPGQTNITLVQFCNQYEVVYTAKSVKDTPELTKEVFIPRGYTALLDAIGHSITDTGNRLSAMKEEDRPSKVIFVILTDGFENASKEYTREKINEMITHQKETYHWQFIFLAANQDAILVGTSLGVNANSSMTYGGKVGTTVVFANATRSVKNFKSGISGQSVFSPQDYATQDAANNQ